jgi:glycerol-3-phosphate acyltransferase PlsY
MSLSVLSAVLAAYALGSVPFALILARRWGAGDLRDVGSGNLGAANVLRASGIRAGVSVLLLDIAKGAGSVLLAQRLTDAGPVPAAAGFAAIVGHIYPVWLRFRGGKGVATACGVFSVLMPGPVPVAVGVFTATVWITRYISLGSVVACVALPVIAFAAGAPTSALTAALGASMLIVFRHRSNLMRVREGREPRVGARVDRLESGTGHLDA